MMGQSGNSKGESRQISAILKRIGVLQCILSVLIFALGFLLAGNRLLVSMMSTILFASGVYLGWMLSGIVDQEYKRQSDEHQRSALKLLAHYRHDVMNQVQLIQGYMQLKKFERLQSPIQKLVHDARRHTQLCNLPGSELPYRLTFRDLSAPLLHLRLADQPDYARLSESEWAALIEGIAVLGEKKVLPAGTPVEWVIRPAHTEQEILFKLDVLGEDVNDTYMEELTAEFSRNGWTVSGSDQAAEQYSLVLRQAR